MEQKETSANRNGTKSVEEALRTACVSLAQELHETEMDLVVECCFRKGTLYYS